MLQPFVHFLGPPLDPVQYVSASHAASPIGEWITPGGVSREQNRLGGWGGRKGGKSQPSKCEDPRTVRKKDENSHIFLKSKVSKGSINKQNLSSECQMSLSHTYSTAQRRTIEVNLEVSLCLPNVPPAVIDATIWIFSKPTHSRFSS